MHAVRTRKTKRVKEMGLCSVAAGVQEGVGLRRKKAGLLLISSLLLLATGFRKKKEGERKGLREFLNMFQTFQKLKFFSTVYKDL
jgi:hypothetical protein